MAQASAGTLRVQLHPARMEAVFVRGGCRSFSGHASGSIGHASLQLHKFLWNNWKRKSSGEKSAKVCRCLHGRNRVFDAGELKRTSRRPTVVAAAQKRRRVKETIEKVEPLQPTPSPTTPPIQNSSEPEPEAAPVPSREQVLKACTVTSLGIGAAGLGLRTAFHAASMTGLPLNDCSGLLPVAFDLRDVLPTVAIIGGVSAIRWLLLSTWTDFRESSEASNRQLLTSLELPDVFLLGLLPGLSEELLFRGFLVPAVSPDWKGAVVAGAVFGVLHISGGRNVAFGAWASAVGVVYGLGALGTQNLAVPVVAHVMNNIIAGLAWKLRHGRNPP